MIFFPFNSIFEKQDKELVALNFVQVYNMGEPEYFRPLFRVAVAAYMNSIHYRRRAGNMVELFFETFKRYDPKRYNVYNSENLECGDKVFTNACNALLCLEITLSTAASAGSWNLIIFLEKLLTSDAVFQKIVLGDIIGDKFELHIQNAITGIQTWEPDAIIPNQMDENNKLFTKRLLALLSGKIIVDADSVHGDDPGHNGAIEYNPFPPIDKDTTVDDFLKFLEDATPRSKPAVVHEHDPSNPEDLRRLFTIAVNSYLEFCDIWLSLIKDMEHYDKSLEYAPTLRWLGTVLHRGHNYLPVELAEAYEDADEFICDVIQDAMDNLIRIVGQILALDKNAQSAVWGRYHTIHPEKAAETLRLLDEGLDDLAYNDDGEICEALYLDLMHEMFAETDEL